MMRNLSRAVLTVLILLLVLLVLVFVLENQQRFTLAFLGWSLQNVPVSIAVILALLVGMGMGPSFAFLFGRIKGKRRRS
ncbi:DUF1049 domain-containing protein [Pseudomonas sp. ICMP22404]|uniref:DUF1049 domain-containing protein n=1 Tax=Pseudomonas sp. ICMP22404 TaxID=2583807 RepID=UPI0035A1BBBE